MFYRFNATLKCPAALCRSKQVNPKIHGGIAQDCQNTGSAQDSQNNRDKMTKAMN